MHLVIIFGPGAVGKMTVGRELCALTGYKLFHNHMSIDPVLGIFDFGTPAFVRLTSELRRRVIEEAVAADLPGLVFTVVWDLDSPDDQAYVETLLAPVRAAGGRIDFVELYADQATRLAREGTPGRLAHKATKRDVARSREILVQLDESGRLNTVNGAFRYPGLLRYDTTHDGPRVVAGRIAADLRLMPRS